MNQYSRALAALSLLLLHTPLVAQQKCSGSEHRQFDFWVGRWEVTAQGGVAGHNEITLEEDGCVLHEHWKGSRGGTGQSFNVYDRAGRLWHQFWVDNSGTVLHLTGVFTNGAMRFGGTTTGPEGKTIHQRLTFTPNPDGSVRQMWEQSPDGEVWTAVFDGLYRKQ
ncbi:MAG: hypothetical protein OEW17_03030 [Gemmatimonadota bacterium]|nr:hypothetical protein [Gemmatimonadota bacterium]MDH4347753.1 hypothetical protein [Gemmatimonadota bacterium]MDH5282565.1 hypothetical protein [Gemmatimonadota bacterium]